MTISERAAGRGFVLGNEGLRFLAILTADVGFEVLWRPPRDERAGPPPLKQRCWECAYDIPASEELTHLDGRIRLVEMRVAVEPLLISSSDSPCRIEYPPTLWVPETASPYATWVYSRMKPPRRSRRRTRMLLISTGGWRRPAGGSCCRRPVRPMSVVMIGVLTKDQPQVPFVGDQHLVQALSAGAAHPALRDRVRPRRPDGRLDDPHAGRGEHPPSNTVVNLASRSRIKNLRPSA